MVLSCFWKQQPEALTPRVSVSCSFFQLDFSISYGSRDVSMLIVKLWFSQENYNTYSGFLSFWTDFSRESTLRKTHKFPEKFWNLHKETQWPATPHHWYIFTESHNTSWLSLLAFGIYSLSGPAHLHYYIFRQCYFLQAVLESDAYLWSNQQRLGENEAKDLRAAASAPG